MKRFNVAIEKDGGIELFPMKEWVREHAGELSHPVDVLHSNSYTVRRELVKQGWTFEETDTQVLLVKPGTTLSESMVNSVLGQGAGEVSDDDTQEASFAMEFQLRDFIASNLPAIAIQGRKLKVYTDPSGRPGIEYRTDVGYIDILAQDDADRSFVVIELKRGRSADRAIGQVARYMGWLRKELSPDKPVQGIIVARKISDELRYAAEVIPNVQLFEYQVNFQLKMAREIR